MTRRWCGSGGVGGAAADADRSFPQERGAAMTAVRDSSTFVVLYLGKRLKFKDVLLEH